MATPPDEHQDRSTAVACTLDGAAVPGRVREWNDLLAYLTARDVLEDGMRLELDDAVPIDELARLVRAEHSCCRFFAFAVTVDERGVALEVRAPPAGMDMVTALFGAA